ncbi:MAG: hypothetical protein A4E66_00818 [Syntrophus sp. PtaB.Bin001]|jgi:hypothetical protein|nr:MAG: hypothetical protein A4E66_00818 [Syntrophus sp. PtaB.Bin001]
MNAIVEKWYPLAAAIIICGCYFFYFRKYPIPDTINNLYNIAVSISAISVGFLATSKSILFTIYDRKIIQWIKSAGLYDSLVDYMMAAIHYCFILSIMSAIGLLINMKPMPEWYSYAFGLWLFIGTAALCSCYRVIHIFSKILRQAT